MNHRNEQGVALLFNSDVGPSLSGLKKAVGVMGLPSCSVDNPDNLGPVISALNPTCIFSLQNDHVKQHIEKAVGELTLIEMCDSVSQVPLNSLSAGLHVALLDCDGGKYYLYREKLKAAPNFHPPSSPALSEANQSLSNGAHTAQFTQAEFAIVKCLVENKGQAVSKDRLAEVALGRVVHPQDRSVDVHICRIRKKISSSFSMSSITSVRGRGYILNSPDF